MHRMQIQISALQFLNDGYMHEHVHVQQRKGQRLVDIEGLREKL